MWRKTVLGVLACALSLPIAGCVAHARDVPDGTPTAAPRGRGGGSSGHGDVPSTPKFEPVRHLTLTIVYDNNAYDSRLKTEWGFACLVETGQATVLFDTGGNGATLLSNMAKLDIDPRQIDAVVLSHAHGDHTGGLEAVLDAGAKPKPKVYVPAAFPASFKRQVRARTELVEVSEPLQIAPGIYTTGEVGSGIVEQALVIESEEGLVVITGCAHPGVVEMVRRAKQVAPGDPELVMGGFHLGSASRGQIETIIADFVTNLGVRRVAPCHCTGDRARQMFAEAFGPNCTLAGVGQVFEIGSESGK